LRAVQSAAASGERDTAALRQAGLAVLAQEPELSLEYLAVVNGDMRERPAVENDPMTRVLVAARMFGVRLIDNMALFPEPEAAPAC
ncbi:pantoate--beta-alanine ligase, partial [Deinococcus sp. MIMF12]